MTPGGPLRVALVVGTLGPGGAEKQLVAMAGALHARGVAVRVLSLGHGEHHEATLRRLGLPPEWVGRHPWPVRRLAAMARRLAPWRPHVVQATHCYTNLYAAALGRLLGAVDVGCVRSDGAHDVAGTGRWGRWLLDAPRAMLANSHAGVEALCARGRRAADVHLLRNVVDLAAFDAASDAPTGPTPARDGRVVAIAVGTLSPVKALDRFVDAIALARAHAPTLEGWVVGDGPEAPRLAARAHAAGVHGAVHFLGRREDVPALLRRADVLVLTSRHEGTPNAVLEAMSAGLPVVATAVGDVPRLVAEGETGHVVAADGLTIHGDAVDAATVAREVAVHLVALAADAPRARRMGAVGRAVIEREHASAGLADRLLRTYALMARRAPAGARVRELVPCPP